MTAEHLLVVDLRELRAGRIVGQKRQATITYQMDQTFRVPDTCPACREDWQSDSPNPIEAFVKACVDPAGVCHESLRRPV